MKNLMVPRSDKSIWDKPRLSHSLATYDQERWLMLAGGSVLAMAGLRRRGVSGGLLAALGGILAARAFMGRRDLRVASHWLDRRITERGWRAKDIVQDASEESFPASDSPAWTTTSGATPAR